MRNTEPHSPAYLTIVKQHWWKGVLFILASAALTYVLSIRMQPMYETTAMVEVDYQQPSGVIGKDAERPFPSNDSDEFLGTQVRLVQSDNVVRPVALRYDLVSVEGQVKGVNPAEDDRVRNAPIALKRLKVSRQPSTRLLLISYRAPNANLAAQAANDIATSYVERVYQLRSRTSAELSHFMEGQLQELKTKMDQSNERLGAFERDMGVINPEQRTSVLSARLLQLNTEYTNAQAERQAKETSYKAMKGGSIEAAQVSSQGEAIAKVNEKLLAAKEDFASLQASLGSKHPEYRKAVARVDELSKQLEDTKDNTARRIESDYHQSLAREQMLSKSIESTRGEFDRANEHVFSYQQAKREAEDDRAMYAELLRKIRESSINAGFQNHNIRIADYARPPSRPVTPNIPLNLAVSVLVSAFLALGTMIAVGATDHTLTSAVQTSRRLNVSVLAALPSVKMPGVGAPRFLTVGGTLAGGPELHAYEESIRKLRNAIVIARDFHQLRSVLITSAVPGEGKSVTAADLAVSCAGQNRRTLLIDADLRRPTLHTRFAVENSVGLGNVLNGDIYWREAVVAVPDAPGLFLLSAGRVNVPATDLFGPALRDLLHELYSEFDQVVIDAPPFLPFAEPVQIASSVDAVVLVVRAGKTNAAAAETVLSTLQWAGANVLGVVLSRASAGEAGAMYCGQPYAYSRSDVALLPAQGTLSGPEV